jgi:filamentous hemagglutinin family protein
MISESSDSFQDASHRTSITNRQDKWHMALKTLPVAGIGLFCALPIAAVNAQIIPDRSLGAESSRINPNVTIKSLPATEISGGATRGANLFHSFRQFNVESGRGAYFANPIGVTNIFSRVTGSSSSNILGRLGVLGNANLFFLNPNGIVFGPNATLDLSGSFLATTANSIKFSDGREFSASNPESAPILLTVNMPTGLDFRAGNRGSILNQSRVLNAEESIVGLLMPPEKTIALIGSDVRLEGGYITAPEGRIELGGLIGEGTVGINFLDSNNFSFTFPDRVARSNVSLSDLAIITVRGNQGGAININVANLNMSGGSRILGGIATGAGFIGSQSGDITINATGKVSITNSGSFISNAVLSDAIGNAGSINITTGVLDLTEAGQIFIGVLGNGNTGSINILADTVSFDGEGKDSNAFSSGLIGEVQIGAVGTIGSINLTARLFSITNGAAIQSSLFGSGSVGKVNINVRDAVLIDGVGFDTFSSGIYNRVERDSIGQVDSINLTAGSLTISNGAVITASTSGNGNAGNVNIHVGDRTILDGVGPVTTIPVGIPVGILQDAGIFQSSGILSSVRKTGVGTGGNITLITQNLSVVNGAAIATNTFGQGRAGNIFINAETIDLAGIAPLGRGTQVSTLLAATEIDSKGRGGDIRVNTNLLKVSDRAAISAVANGEGNGGNVEVNASSILLNDNALVSVSNFGLGNAGNITLRSQDIQLRRLSNISTDNQLGNGGNISINTGVIAAFPRENSNITANALQNGAGGNINITAQSIFGFISGQRTDISVSSITASSQFGRQGQITFTTPEVNPSSALVQLSENVVDPNALISQNPCAKQGGSEFIVSGTGGLPPDPHDTLSSDVVRSSLIEPAPFTTNHASTNPTVAAQTVSSDRDSPQDLPRRIVPAQGWVVNEQGELILIADTGLERDRDRLRLWPTICK